MEAFQSQALAADTGEAETDGADGSDQRGLGRAEIAFESQLEIPRGRFKCTVHDLSLQGARVATGESGTVGQSLWLKIDRLRVFGSVHCAKPGSIGVRFDQKLPKAFVLSLLGESGNREAYREAETLLAARDWVVGAVPLNTGSVSAADMLSARHAKPGAESYLKDGLWWYMLNRQRHMRSEHRHFRRNAIALLVAAAVLGSSIGLASSLLL